MGQTDPRPDTLQEAGITCGVPAKDALPESVQEEMAEPKSRDTLQNKPAWNFQNYQGNESQGTADMWLQMEGDSRDMTGT